VHDVAVGELCNPDVPHDQRKAADRMFYHACRHDGCNRRLAAILYIGVRFGSWSAKLGSVFKAQGAADSEAIRRSPEQDYITDKFWRVVDAAERAIETDDLDTLDEILDAELGD
jgi:hypothetical protein